MEFSSRILRVDLSRETVEPAGVDGSTLRRFIGGVGLGAHILSRETSPAVQPFSPENRLMFLAGPLTGMVPQSSRFAVCALSPMSDAWGEAHMGGTFGAEFSRTGFSGIVFSGRAERPVYLYVKNGEATLRDAGHLWGRDTFEADERLKEETDARASVACIGRAGERLVRFAGIVGDGRMARVAARCGMGAVVGSKNLKAVVVRGTRKPPVADAARLEAVSRELNRLMTRIVSGELGPRREPTAALARSNEVGTLGVRNQSLPRWPAFARKFQDSFPLGKHYHCRLCPSSCVESHVIESGRQQVLEMLMPVGTNCLIDDFDALQQGYELCNRYGIDTISFGYTLAFAMECFEEGLITTRDTGGIKLAWGSTEAMLQMIRQVGENEGFGRVLSQGTKRAAAQIGGGAAKYAMQVKGLELTHWDPRIYNSLALGYATGNKGASHLESPGHTLERRQPEAPYGIDLAEFGYPGGVRRLGFDGKAALAKKVQDMICLLNSLTMCQFSFQIIGVRIAQYVEMLNAVTGWEMTGDEFLMTGERIFNQKRLINLSRGLGHKDDTLPDRILTRFANLRDDEQGIYASREEFERHLQEYYALRGWSAEGVPTPQKRQELGLE